MELVFPPLRWLILLPPVFLCVLLSYLYAILWLRPERLREKLRSQGVKGPKPSFLFGNIVEMRRIQKELAMSVQELQAGTTDKFSSDYAATLFPYFLHWSRIYGSIFLYSTGSIQVLNMTDPDMVKELANYKSSDIGRPLFLQKERRALLGMGILTSNGELWAHQRKVIAPELFMDKVKVKSSLKNLP
jgi:cytochrome P450